MARVLLKFPSITAKFPCRQPSSPIFKLLDWNGSLHLPTAVHHSLNDEGQNVRIQGAGHLGDSGVVDRQTQGIATIIQLPKVALVNTARADGDQKANDLLGDLGLGETVLGEQR